MTVTNSNRMRSASGFTLMELLVVIAILGILAGLTVGVLGPVSDTKKRKGVEADLKRLVTAIESYKAKFGHYPPDSQNPNILAPDRNWRHPLFYELTGTLVTNRIGFQRLDGSQKDVIVGGDGPLYNNLGVRGFVNASPNRSDVKVFISDLRPAHHATAFVSPELEVLTVTVPGPALIVAPNGQRINPWRYNASNPTNNPGKYDLWADVVIGKATNTIGNWHR